MAVSGSSHFSSRAHISGDTTFGGAKHRCEYVGIRIIVRLKPSEKWDERILNENLCFLI